MTRFPGVLQSLGLSLSPKNPGKGVKSDFDRLQVENHLVWFSQCTNQLCEPRYEAGLSAETPVTPAFSILIRLVIE